MKFYLKINRALLAVTLLLGVLSVHAETSIDPIQLLQASDRARGAAAFTEGLSWTADIETRQIGASDSDKTQVTYLIKARGDDALAEAISPARNRGEMMLFNDRNLWFFKVGLRKPVAISARQKLLGQAANGDIASIHYARDYDAQVLNLDTVEGTLAWKLELKAKMKNVTYDRIRYWISKKEKLGIKAEFLTVEGEVFKKADFQYKNTLIVRDQSLPFISQAVITDNQSDGEITTLHYTAPRTEKHSIGTFNVNNLIR